MTLINRAGLFSLRGILLAEQHRYGEAVRSYENAIHFRPRLAGKRNVLLAYNTTC